MLLTTKKFKFIKGASDPNSKEFAPLECSHENYTFEDQDNTIISKIRTWIKTFFKTPDSLKFSSDIKLSNRSKVNYDFDVLVKIVDKKKVKDGLVFTVTDETDT